ncbi:MAG: hypothetical protein WED04_11000 [Promethearchaeati archaeon SRVP18_Atabeyarchaeia-1]
MVENAMKSFALAGTHELDDNGDVVTLENGQIKDFHLISPEADPERMRVVGALAEMLCEQIKKTFGVDRLLVAAQNRDFKLIMFPSKDGFLVWKTNLDLQRVMAAIDSNRKSL